MWTYLVLWGMRQSAKLNLFLGVRNLGVEFLPQHLRYLQSFFRRRAMNALFPLSIVAATLLVVLLARRTLHPEALPFETAGYALLTSIAAARPARARHADAAHACRRVVALEPALAPSHGQRGGGDRAMTDCKSRLLDNVRRARRTCGGCLRPHSSRRWPTSCATS